MTRILAGLALLALTACAEGERYCTAAQVLALGLDVGGSWAADAHYADANEICDASVGSKLKGPMS